MIDESTARLDRWLRAYGWEGYDPYDVKGTRIGQFFQHHWRTRAMFETVVSGFPLLSRRLLGVDRRVNAKGMALFARGYLNLWNQTGEGRYLARAKEALDWLSSNPSDGYDAYCWGYPFDWQSRRFIPEATPSSVVTSTAIHAFLDAYELTGDSSYRDVAVSASEFLRSELNRTTYDDGRICFSYTPLDTMHVHNANLFTASALLRASRHDDRPAFVRDGERAVRFTTESQNADGSWYYWAPPSDVDGVIDNYHTGFVLEHLCECRRVLGSQFEYDETLRDGLAFYDDRLFTAGGIPKFDTDSTFPIDIHSCAQGIITFCELAEFAPEYINRARQVREWTVSEMQADDGHFYYQKHPHRTDKTPYLRWGQAWMLRALSYEQARSDHSD